MNKTLLLILCDFLLLTILSMWKMEDEAPPPSDTIAEGQSEASTSAMQMMEQDLLDTLRYSLEEEKAEQSELSQNLAERNAELERKQQEIENRESRIQNLEETLTDAERRERELAAQRQQLETQKSSLEQTVASVKEDYAKTTQRLEQTEAQVLQSQAQSRLLQEELQQRLKDIEAKEKALAATSKELDATKEKVRELDVQVKMSEQEKVFLRESVQDLQGEVVAEREERQRLQEQAGVLAEGVTKLAESSQDLRQELRSNFEINANQIFSEFGENRLKARFSAVKYQRNRYVNTEETTVSVMISDGTKTYALFHLSGAPFGVDSNPGLIRSIQFELERRGTVVRPSQVQFLTLDPRIVVVPLSDSEVKRLGGKPYLTALKPFKFPEAVLVNQDGGYYGEVDFKLDADTPGFVKMQTKIFSSIFGDFSPSIGDLVFSKTGELLGVMVNKRYCALVNNFVPVASYPIQGEVNKDELGRVLKTLDSTLGSFPSPLR